MAWMEKIWTAMLRWYAVLVALRTGRLPSVHHGPSVINQLVLEKCRDKLLRPFLPTWWACTGLLQTLLGLLLTGGSTPAYKREHLQMEDGGIVSLDWVPDEQLANAGIGRLSNVLLVVSSPFLGTTWNSYFVNKAIASRYRPVVFHKRSYGNTPMTTARVEPMGDPSDLIEAMDYVDHLYPFSKIFVLGLSCSGATVLNYATSIITEAKAVAVCCISPTSYRLFSETHPSSTITRQPYTFLMQTVGRQPVTKRKVSFNDRSPSYEDANKNFFPVARPLPEDVTKDVTTVMAYWRRKQSYVNFSKLSIPTLLLHSTDDPVVKASSDDFQTAEYLMRVEMQRGGHVGFFTDFFPRSWAADVAFTYFDVVASLSRRRSSSSRLSSKSFARRLST